MRARTFGLYAICVLALSACGSNSTFANKPRPPSPVNLTVYINNARVSVSPDSVGAGPVAFIVTNQASHTESLQIQPPGGGQPLATTGPINPQGTAQVTVDFHDPGDYTAATSDQGASQAAQAAPASIHPARIHIGPPRSSASNELLQP